MIKFLLALLCLTLSQVAYGDTCEPPLQSEPYAAISAASDRDMRLLLNEYMYRHRWARHGEARAAGFRAGDRVYGEVLQDRDQSFDPSRVAQWRRAYERSSRKVFLSSLGKAVSMDGVDRRVVEWVLETCLDAGLWSRVVTKSDCGFEFSAGVKRVDPTMRVTAKGFDARGARCTTWPAGALTSRGATVQCVRTGDGEATLTLVTDRAGGTTQRLPPLEASVLAPEPVLETRLSEPVPEVLRLTRSLDYRLVGLSVGCPGCKLYAAEIRPSTPGAVILEAATLSSSGAGWRRCPAGLRCRVYEFSPPDVPHLSGCAGASACRVWRLAETEAEGVDVVQLTTQSSEAICVNCPAGVDFETARASWAAAKEKAAVARCEQPDLRGGTRSPSKP